jgi:hypothetical protein
MSLSVFLHKLCQPDEIFVGKTIVYLSEELGKAPGFAHKHYTKLERLDRDKQFSL